MHAQRPRAPTPTGLKEQFERGILKPLQDLSDQLWVHEQRRLCSWQLRRRLRSLLCLLGHRERVDGHRELDVHHQPELPEQLRAHLHPEHLDLHDRQVPGRHLQGEAGLRHLRVDLALKRWCGRRGSMRHRSTGVHNDSSDSGADGGNRRHVRKLPVPLWHEHRAPRLPWPQPHLWGHGHPHLHNRRLHQQPVQDQGVLRIEIFLRPFGGEGSKKLSSTVDHTFVVRSS